MTHEEIFDSIIMPALQEIESENPDLHIEAHMTYEEGRIRAIANYRVFHPRLSPNGETNVSFIFDDLPSVEYVKWRVSQGLQNFGYIR